MTSNKCWLSVCVGCSEILSEVSFHVCFQHKYLERDTFFWKVTDDTMIIMTSFSDLKQLLFKPYTSMAVMHFQTSHKQSI